MTAWAVTVPSGSPSGAAGPPDGPPGVPPWGMDVDDVDGDPDSGVTGSPDGATAGTDGAGGVGAVAWAPAGTATAETHTAANAAPLTSDLRTPGPFFTNLAR
ncbi:hypothetical protein [Actinomadura sp. 3N508]|uniref:hypothetical protein n=1 Tax=Actinomadura sp. 3N508 TaxID=3375153 RepID=UPI003790C1B0